MQIIINVNDEFLIETILDYFSEIDDISSICSSDEDIKNNLALNLCDFSGEDFYNFDISDISITGFDTFKDKLKQKIKKQKLEELEEDLKW